MPKKNRNKSKKAKKNTSPAQIQANQQNAKLSTGPKTAETKAISAKNSLKHGLTSQKFSLLDWEDPQVFSFFQAGILQRWNPQTEEETFWVNQVIQNAWRMQRAIELETQALRNLDNTEDSSRTLDRFRRYSTSLERSLEKAELRLNTLKGQEPLVPQPATKCPNNPPKPPQSDVEKLHEAEQKALKAFSENETYIALYTDLPQDTQSILERWEKFKPAGSQIPYKSASGKLGFVSQTNEAE